MNDVCSYVSLKAKVIFPDELARAVWGLGKEVFEHVYLGNVGRTGAAEYWANARERCAWYPPNIPENCHIRASYRFLFMVTKCMHIETQILVPFTLWDGVQT